MLLKVTHTCSTHLLSAELSRTLKRLKHNRKQTPRHYLFSTTQDPIESIVRGRYWAHTLTLSNNNGSVEVITAEKLFNNSKITSTLIVDLKDWQNKNTRHFVQQLIHQPNPSDQWMIIFSSTPAPHFKTRYFMKSQKYQKSHKKKKKEKTLN